MRWVSAAAFFEVLNCAEAEIIADSRRAGGGYASAYGECGLNSTESASCYTTLLPLNLAIGDCQTEFSSSFHHTASLLGEHVEMNVLAVVLVLASMVTSAPLVATAATPGATTATYHGRSMIVYVPSRPSHDLPLVVVLHGGLGSAQRIASQESESALNINSLAERYGFIVAYLNGTPATRYFGADKLAWNAGGGCCGQSAANNVDDVGYITDAVRYLEEHYQIDEHRVYGMGHSNGAMMTQRLVCETPLYQAAVVISGPLNLDTTTCPAAQGKRVLAIHGADDENVPIAGGRGTQGFSKAEYRSESSSRDTMVRSGATYDLHIIPGVGHRLDDINAAVQRSEGHTIGELAISFFGLH